MDIYGLKSNPSPCDGCTERWVNENGTCHGSCERYDIFVANTKAKNRQIAEERGRFLRNPIAENKSMAKLNRMKKERKK